VLDDEPALRKALGRLLRVHGYQVAPFANGESFLAALPGQRFDCVLMDLHLPGLDGFSVLLAMQALPAAVPVIVLTGYDRPGNATRVAELGASAYLTKPVDEALLLEAITRHASSPAAGLGAPN
jgi:CheY-like chemotaxis protein